ncbi:serine hydrolase domain-containing protein [Flavobacteriaceae bacterium 3-367]|uniref:serine hydrolase domain-containing protein n=1 Tax=Eudoraea algarum TaxID=3417568 RepID=UPI0032909DFD
MKKGLLLLAMSSVLFLGFGQQTDQDREALVRSMGEALIGKKWMPPGISIAIMQHGKMVYAEGFGYADLENKRPVTTKTQFRAASVSKMMTVTALARLVQEGRVDLDAPIQKYIPEYDQKRYPITARLLAGHLSGMPHYSSGDNIQKKFYNSVEASLRVFSHHDLLSEPGTEYKYSTHAYTLLSAVVEGAGGTPFLDYLKKSVLQPLEMRHTGPDLRAQPPQTMTELYGLKDGIPEKIEHPEDPSYKWGGGGMVSTPIDLVKMGNAYLNGFIRSNTVALMFKSQQLKSGSETGVGIGWRRSWDMDGRPVFEHAGAMGGARSILSIFLDDGLVIAIMANTYSPGSIEETAHMIALPFLGEAKPLPQPRGMSEITITTFNSEGEEIIAEGLLILNGKTDRLVLHPDSPEKQTYPLIYMQSDNIYALAHPRGLLYTKIVLAQHKVSGFTMRYRSPRNEPPTSDQPFLRFEGKLQGLKGDTPEK